jgi:hypothetical protein
MRVIVFVDVVEAITRALKRDRKGVSGEIPSFRSLPWAWT